MPSAACVRRIAPSSSTGSGRDQHVYLTQGLQELLAQENTRFEGTVIHFGRYQGGSLEPCARGTIEFGSTGP